MNFSFDANLRIYKFLNFSPKRIRTGKEDEAGERAYVSNEIRKRANDADNAAGVV